MRPVPAHREPARWPGLLLALCVGAGVGIAVDRSLRDADPTPSISDAPPATTASVAGPAAPPIDPTTARNAVLAGLEAAGVARSTITHGLYPLVGAGRDAGATLPLVSFGCPAARDCAAVLNKIDEQVVAAGGTMVAGRADAAGRPYFRAVAQADRPALVIRAFPPGPRLAVVIEQVGREPALLDALLALDPHVTYAVAPNTRDGTRIARRLADSGREVIVDLPLEPIDANAADGPDFLTTQMAPDVLTRTLHRHLDAVPGAVGAGVHLGGRFTRSQSHLTVLLEGLKARGLYFVDDPDATKDGPRSLAATTVRMIGNRAIAPTHHIDAHGEPLAARLRAVEAALVLEGQAVVVLAPRPAALVAIRPWLEGLRRRKISLLRVSEIVR